MDKINFKDGQLVTEGYVEIDGVQHNITEAVYEGETPFSSLNLNKMQDNIEKAINEKADEVKLDEKLDKTGGTIQGSLNIEGDITKNGEEIALLKTCVSYRSFPKLDESVLDDIPTLLGADYQSR